MIEDFLKEIIPALRKQGAIVMTRNGIKADSDLIKSFDFDVGHNNTLRIEANSYYLYVDRGRKPLTDKVPIKPLIRWIRKYGIRPSSGQSYTQLAFAIQQSIYRNGIKGKNYLNRLNETYAELTEEELGEYLEEELLDDIVQSLTIK